MIQQTTQFLGATTVRLTPVHDRSANGVNVAVTELLTYSQHLGFTRLRLTGQKTLDVQESTETIDRLIRNAAEPSAV